MENTEPVGWTRNLWGPQKLTFPHLVKNAHDWVSLSASSLEVFLLMSHPSLPLKGRSQLWSVGTILDNFVSLSKLGLV